MTYTTYKTHISILAFCRLYPKPYEIDSDARCQVFDHEAAELDKVGKQQLHSPFIVVLLPTFFLGIFNGYFRNPKGPSYLRHSFAAYIMPMQGNIPTKCGSLNFRILEFPSIFARFCYLGIYPSIQE